MNKSDFWQAIWIPVKKRKPPQIDEMILAWNPIWKKAFSIEGYIAHEAANTMERKDSITNDRIFTHWCQPIGPGK